MSAFEKLLREELETSRGDLPDNLDLRDPVEIGERTVAPHGRIDISVENDTTLVFIEVKVDASEGKEQLKRYAKALDQLADDRDALLVFLTLDPEEASTSDRAYVHITFRDLLRAWLPIAATTRAPETTYLSMYLKTVAQRRHGLAGGGEFDQWMLHTQRAALAFIEQELEA